MELTKIDYFFSHLYESINIKENNMKNISVLFTDMVGSSKSWQNEPEKMITALEDQSKLVDKFVKKYNGLVCKTIGDAFMIVFSNFENSIKCAIDIQKSLIEDPIKIGKNNTILRIGICYGPVYESVIKIQDISLKDYFGNTVNTAARLESKVADESGIAFAISEVDSSDINLDNILKPYDVDLISFKNKDDKEIKRSTRILTDIHRHMYKNIKELKGVEEIDVFKIKIK